MSLFSSLTYADLLWAALLTLLLGQEFNARNILASVFVMVWAARLAGRYMLRLPTTASKLLTLGARFSPIPRLEDRKRYEIRRNSLTLLQVLRILGWLVLASAPTFACTVFTHYSRSNNMGLDCVPSRHYPEFP